MAVWLSQPRHNWKHCLSVVSQPQRLISRISEGVHHSNRLTKHLKPRTNLYHFQRNVHRCCIISTAEANPLKKPYLTFPSCSYSTLSGVSLLPKGVVFPSRTNCLIAVRSLSDHRSKSNGTSSSDDSIHVERETNPTDDLSKHPEVKEIIKEMMKDFEDETDEKLENNVTGSLSDDSSSSEESGLSSSDSDEEVSDNLRKALQVEEWEVIDVDKELSKYNIEEFYGIEYTEEIQEDETVPSREELLPIALNRGETGVFDVEDLVAVLKDDNLTDICVIRIPKEIQFVDYMVLATGKSIRQLTAAAENLQWIWKRKRGKKDPPSVKVEGRLSKNWLALDMGNIALHLFLPEVREEYDLETLWTCGPEFDGRNTTHQETYSIPVSTGQSLEESRHTLISNIDKQIRMKKQGQRTTDEEVSKNTSLESDTGMMDIAGLSQENDSFAMSKNLFDNDSPSKRIQRKYMTKQRDDVEELGFENRAGYHTKYKDSEP